jgi:hypothetical protein
MDENEKWRLPFEARGAEALDFVTLEMPFAISEDWDLLEAMALMLVARADSTKEVTKIDREAFFRATVIFAADETKPHALRERARRWIDPSYGVLPA